MSVFRGRNIEKIYEKAVCSGVVPSLGAAVEVLRPLRHVLVITGFFVLHQRGAAGPCGHLGGGETDGPLGALAVLRALVARGGRASLFCDEHNGPVVARAYEAMLSFFEASDQGFHARLLSHSRCLSFVKATEAYPEEVKEQVFGQKALGSLELRSLSCCVQLARALTDAWGEVTVDGLFSLEPRALTQWVICEKYDI